MGHQVHPFMHCIDKVEPQDSGLYHWRTSSTPTTEHDHLFYLTVEGERSCSRGIFCSFILRFLSTQRWLEALFHCRSWTTGWRLFSDVKRTSDDLFSYLWWGAVGSPEMWVSVRPRPMYWWRQSGAVSLRLLVIFQITPLLPSHVWTRILSVYIGQMAISLACSKCVK